MDVLRLKKVAALVSALAVHAVLGVVGAPPGAADPIGFARRTIGGIDQIVTIDLQSGAVTLVGDSGLPPSTQALTFSPGGVLYGTNSGSPERLVTVDQATGAATVVGPMANWIATGMTFDADGGLWAIGGNPSHLYSVDPETGDSIQIGPLGQEILRGLVAECDGTLLTLSPETDTLLRIDPAGPSIETIGPLGHDILSGSLSWDADGTLWMLSQIPNGIATYTVDPDTGAATLIFSGAPQGTPTNLAIAPLSGCPDPPPTSSTTTPTTSPSTSSVPSTVTPTTAAQALTATPRFTG